MAPAPLGLVVFRYLGPAGGKPGGREARDGRELDTLNERLLQQLHATGRIMLTQTRLNGKYVIRLALGHLTTREADVRRAWAMITEAARELGSQGADE
jgi:aromatic-L-amino-acid decarboxylase